MNRGIIAPAGIVTKLDKGFTMERSLSIEELYYLIMYWDKIIIPSNNLVYIGIPQEEILISSGAIERPKINCQGSFNGDMIANLLLSSQSIVSKELMKDTSTDWVIHQIGDEAVYPENFNVKKNIIQINLANALPVPNKDISIYEILKFKEVRKDELNELHNSLDELYLNILSSPDSILESKKSISKLKNDIEVLNKVSKEKFKTTKKYDLTTELNLNPKDISYGAIAGGIFDFFSTGYTIPIGTIIGASLSAIKINAKASMSFAPASQNTKLSYLSKASNENILIK